MHGLLSHMYCIAPCASEPICVICILGILVAATALPAKLVIPQALGHGDVAHKRPWRSWALQALIESHTCCMREIASRDQAVHA